MRLFYVVVLKLWKNLANQAIAAAIQHGLKASGLPETSVQVINISDRAAVGQLITMSEYVDVIVPRGGKVRSNASAMKRVFQ